MNPKLTASFTTVILSVERSLFGNFPVAVVRLFVSLGAPAYHTVIGRIHQPEHIRWFLENRLTLKLLQP